VSYSFPALASCSGRKSLAFIKVISTLQPSPALLKELTALSSSKKRKTAVSAGSRGTTLGVGPKASQHPPILNAEKRKTNELVNSVDSTEPADTRSALATVRASTRVYLCHRQTSCLRQPATRAPRRRGDVRGYSGRCLRPKSAKWDAEAHSHGFTNVRTRCLIAVRQ